MFTGIVETLGQVKSTKQVDGDVRLVITSSEFENKEIAIGDSVACNGVCLTVIERHGADLSFDVSVESIQHSLIGDWVAGTNINLELALLPTTRLGGHLVSGHVDGLAKLTGLRQDARSWRMVFESPDDMKKYIAKKGSITINGTSLTVNSVDDKLFDINVIPHTLEVTTLGDLKVGDQVHIEVDLIARYLERLLSGESSSESSISQGFLAEHGFT